MGKEFPVILERNIGISDYQGQKQTKTCFRQCVGQPRRIIHYSYRESCSLTSHFFCKNDISNFKCSRCKQKKCTKDKKQFDCTKCQRKTTLVCRYYVYAIYKKLLVV